MTRFVCQERNRALIVVMDNCDKGKLEEQLLMFQVAQWVRDQFRCLVFLPIRDVTYDLYRDRPPLDTALKDMVFRIDAPSFQKVLEKRILLAIQQMEMKGSAKLTYQFPNGIKVEYPASDQGMYLVSIMASLLEHDKFIRRTITALAGRDVRRAMEIFLEFCNSGHIGEGEIFQIRAAKGQYTIPYHVVARVLLRMNRRYYSGDHSYLCNLFQCDPTDQRPDHLNRVAILRWLKLHMSKHGPAGVRGYHRCQTMISALVPFGHEAERLRTDTLYLVQKGCIVTEHQRTDELADEDLICITPSGWVHLDLLTNIDYISACSEDLWMGDKNTATRIADRIGKGRTERHFRRTTMIENANEVSGYLERYQSKTIDHPELFIEEIPDVSLHDLSEMHKEVESALLSIGRGPAWKDAAKKYTPGTEVDGIVSGIMNFGALVELESGVQALLHVNQIPRLNCRPILFKVGDKIKVRVHRVRPEEFKIDLAYVGEST